MNLPEELQRREARIQRIGEARRALEARAREQAESAGKKPEEAEPTPKTQYNFTDPESRIMKGPEGFVQAYNTQIAVEPNFQLIVGQTVTPAANDKQQMTPLVEAIRETIRTETGRSSGGQRILLGGKPQVPAEEANRRIRGHGEAKARRATGAL